jgi:hypothetical protein
MPAKTVEDREENLNITIAVDVSRVCKGHQNNTTIASLDPRTRGTILKTILSRCYEEGRVYPPPLVMIDLTNFPRVIVTAQYEEVDPSESEFDQTIARELARGIEGQLVVIMNNNIPRASLWRTSC